MAPYDWVICGGGGFVSGFITGVWWYVNYRMKDGNA